MRIFNRAAFSQFNYFPISVHNDNKLLFINPSEEDEHNPKLLLQGDIDLLAALRAVVKCI